MPDPHTVVLAATDKSPPDRTTLYEWYRKSRGDPYNIDIPFFVNRGRGYLERYKGETWGMNLLIREAHYGLTAVDGIVLMAKTK